MINSFFVGLIAGAVFPNGVISGSVAGVIDYIYARDPGDYWIRTTTAYRYDPRGEFYDTITTYEVYYRHPAYDTYTDEPIEIRTWYTGTVSL